MTSKPSSGADLPQRPVSRTRDQIASGPILSESSGLKDKNKADLDANIAACRAKCRIVVE